MRYLLTVEYLGTRYSGWQRQKNAMSIQQILEEELSRLLQERIIVVGSGRTDSGVHAINQKAHFETNNAIEMQRIPLAINTKLPSDIRIKDIKKVDKDFHAQHDAKSRIYLYKFYISRILSPLRYGKFAQIIPPIDFYKMQKGANLLLGEHNFQAFSSSGSSVQSTIRKIEKIELCKQQEELFLLIEGNGFLYNMVRIIAGTLVDLGKGKITENNIKNALKYGERTQAGRTFPACGLYLKDVIY